MERFFSSYIETEFLTKARKKKDLYEKETNFIYTSFEAVSFVKFKSKNAHWLRMRHLLPNYRLIKIR